MNIVSFPVLPVLSSMDRPTFWGTLAKSVIHFHSWRLLASFFVVVFTWDPSLSRARQPAAPISLRICFFDIDFKFRRVPKLHCDKFS